MDPENSLCTSCRRREAEMFCACTSPETLLCGNCIRKHIINNPWKEHCARPINLLRSYKIPGFFPRFEARRDTFPKVREQALTSLQSIDKALAEFSALAQKTAREILTHAEATQTKLQETQIYLSREVQFALEEVERTLGEDQPRLTTLYGPAFRGMTEKPQPFQLFTFTISSAPPQTVISIQPNIVLPQDLFVHPEVPKVSAPISPPPPVKEAVPQYLASVFKNTLTLYNIQTELSTRHALSVDFGAGGSYVLLDPCTLLCIGSYPASCSVYLLDLLSFQLRSLPGLLAARCAAGVAKAEGCIYVFGGEDNTGQGVTTSSKASLKDYNWSQLLGMHYPRVGFTPCNYRSLIYLVSVGSKNHRAVETFNPVSGTFAVLSISLSKQLGFGVASVAFVAKGELCVLTEFQLRASWKIESERSFRLNPINKACCSTQQPLINGNHVLIACLGEVMKFNLDSYSFL